jgi:hypothetical protein
MTRSSRSLLLVVCACVALFAAGCHSSKKRCGSLRSDVVACVDGTPVFGPEVGQLMREHSWSDGSARIPDPRRAAVEQAIRLVLFAREAQRLSLPMPQVDLTAPVQATAVRARAFIDHETRQAKLSPEEVPEADVNRTMAENDWWFRKLEDVRISGIAIADPARAEEIYKSASKATTSDEFRSSVASHSEDAESKLKGGDLGRPPENERYRQRLIAIHRDIKPGRIFGPVREMDGYYWIVRIDDVKLGEFRKEISPEERVRRTRRYLALSRADKMLESHAVRLRAAAPVEIYDAELAKVPLAERTQLIEDPLLGVLPKDQQNTKAP